jgi:polyhydroxybutyrate depolymerase
MLFHSSPPSFLGTAFLLISAATAIPHGSSPRSASSSPGCNKSLPSSFQPGGPTTNHTLLSGAHTRSFLLHLPLDYTSNVPAPLILSFHGRSRNATYQETLSQFSLSEYNPSWIAVYPQGLNNSWQGPDYAVPDANDVGFVSDLLDWLETELCVDVSKIYATGKSNGGGFTGTLACDGSGTGDRIAAFAPVSGAFYDFDGGAGCKPDRKGLPVLEFHGSNDTTIPYEGGDGLGGSLPDIGAWLDWWAKWNGCPEDGKKVSEVAEGEVQVTSWDCGKNRDKEVIGYKVAGLGHDWPSLTPNLDNDKPSVIEATSVIMKWFAKWSLADKGWTDA